MLRIRFFRPNQTTSSSLMGILSMSIPMRNKLTMRYAHTYYVKADADKTADANGAYLLW